MTATALGRRFGGVRSFYVLSLVFLAGGKAAVKPRQRGALVGPIVAPAPLCLPVAGSHNGIGGPLRLLSKKVRRRRRKLEPPETGKEGQPALQLEV